MSFTEDPGELIAAELVEYFKHEDRGFDADVPFECSVPEDPSKELYAESRGVRVLVIPVGNTGEKFDRGTHARVVHLVNVIVIAPLSALHTRRRLSGFVFSLLKSARGEKRNGYFWHGEETITKYDPDEVKNKREFLSAFQLQYVGVE